MGCCVIAVIGCVVVGNVCCGVGYIGIVDIDVVGGVSVIAPSTRLPTPPTIVT